MYFDETIRHEQSVKCPVELFQNIFTIDAQGNLPAPGAMFYK